jgi:hypothetical protein
MGGCREEVVDSFSDSDRLLQDGSRIQGVVGCLLEQVLGVAIS